VFANTIELGVMNSLRRFKCSLSNFWRKCANLYSGKFL